MRLPKPHRLIAFGLVGIGLTTLFALLPVQAWLLSLAERLAAFGIAGAILFGLAYAVSAMVLVPASALSFVSGFVYGPSGLALAWCAMMTVALLSRPLAGRWLAPTVLNLVRRRRELAAVMSVIEEEGWRMVLLVRISGIVPFGLQNYILGLVDLPTRPYLLATAVGVIPSILLYGGTGVLEQRALLEGLNHPVAFVIPALAISAGIALVVLTTRKVRQRLSAYR